MRFTEGPFLGVAGLFDSRRDDERVAVLFNLLGRPVKANVPLRAITPDA
ncbi:MAG: hypothetical protein ACE5H8_12410 [Alphaproteobacteria bacterium]